MHSILISITKPDGNPTKEGDWNQTVLRLADEAAQNKAVQVLGPSSWLILGTDGLPLLGSAVADSKRKGFVFQVLIIQDACEWPATPLTVRTIS